jgi:16S rRNA (guanine527-N7)-methyltransferase
MGATPQPAGTPAARSSPLADAPDAALWRSLGWRPDPGQLASFQELQHLLRQWNGRVNLSRLVEGDDYWIGQVYDSLWPLRSLIGSPAAAEPLRLIDVGTGGGFPGMAAAIALPAARLTLVDSVGRKVEAVRAMADSLGLAERVDLRCERIERSGRASDCRGRFEWAMARAVASAPVVAEYLVPLLAPRGRAILYRGQWSTGDQTCLERAARQLNAAVTEVERCDLPGGRGVRHALILRPLAPCPAAYPRPVGVALKAPLGEAD